MKYYGQIGYTFREETSPSVWEDKIVERDYTGDVLRFNSRRVTGEKVNSDINVSNRISVIADPFAYANFQNITYVSWLGTKWLVSNVEVDHPRLILDVGGVYNG